MRARPTSLAVAAFLAAACSGGSDPRTRPAGATSFEGQPPGGSSSAYREGAVAGQLAPGAATDTAGGTPGTTTTARSVEEADVYQRVGSTLYVLNAYRGLMAVDLSAPASPRLLWRVPVTGRPVDLYVRGDVALLTVGDAFSYVTATDGSVRPHLGSRLLAVTVGGTNPPSITADLAVEGAVEQTRLVGDVLYVVSRRYAWYDWVPGSGGMTIGTGSAGSGTVSSGSGSSTAIAPVAAGAVAPGTDTVFVASYDVRAPSSPAAVDRVELSATGWETHAHVTAERVTLSFAGYGMDAAGSYAPRTEFRFVDISDPTGAMKLGTSASMAGRVQDRWSMDFDATTGIFRAVANLGWNQGAALATWRSPGVGTATELSRLAIPVEETLTAARFDGPRVYVVTAKRTDPLWAVDASDPANPHLEGSLHMPGQLEFIEPRGERLVALGHTDETAGTWRLAVTLLDVADLAAPRQLGRVAFGPSWGSIGASADDLRKAFLVFDPTADAAGLILVPFQGWDATTWRFVGATQLVDYAPDTLTLRGSLQHPGAISRAFPLDTPRTTLAALSDTALQTIAASNRDAPVELARLDLARSVSTLTLAQGKAVELCGDWYRGAMELVVTEALDPDAATPLARVDLAAPEARMLRDGDIAWILAHDGTGGSWLQAVDLANPLTPRPRGRLALAPGESFGYGRWWGYGDEAVLVGHALAVHHGAWACPGVCVAAALASGAGDASAPNPGEIRVYDLSDPDHPRLASTVTPLGAAWAWGLATSGTHLWLTHFEWNADLQLGRYYLDRIDLADPSSPKLLAKVNVPGVFFAASADGRRIFTVETEWSQASVTTSLHRLALDGATATLEASVAVDGYPSGVASGGGFAWIVTGAWTAGSTARLVTVDLSAMAKTSEQGVAGTWAWLRTAAGGKLFLDAGWQQQGLLLYDLADPAHPTFDRFFPTQGWVSDIVIGDGRAWLPSGPYGVPIVDLR